MQQDTYTVDEEGEDDDNDGSVIQSSSIALTGDSSPEESSEEVTTVALVTSTSSSSSSITKGEEKRARLVCLERLMREKESLQTELDSLFHMKIITDLQDDFYQAMEMKQLELSVLQFKHQVLQANYKKLHEEAMESLRREKEDKEHIKSLFEERLQDVDSTYTDLLVAKQEEHLLHLQQSAIEVQELQQSLARAESMLQDRQIDQQQELSRANTQLVENQDLITQLQQQQQRHDEIVAQAVLQAEELETVKKELDDLRLAYTQLQVRQVENQELMAQQRHNHEEMLVQAVAQALEPVSKELNDLRVAHTQLQEEKQVENQDLIARLEQQQHIHDEMVAQAVLQAVEPVKKELDDLRVAYTQLQQQLTLKQAEHQELKDRMEPFIKELEGSEAEKRALLANYTKLIGHQNTRQKINHLSKLKDDILELRKELDRERKLRTKAEAKVKELSSGSSLQRNRNSNQQQEALVFPQGREPFRELILQ